MTVLFAEVDGSGPRRRVMWVADQLQPDAIDPWPELHRESSVKVLVQAMGSVGLPLPDLFGELEATVFRCAWGEKMAPPSGQG